MEVTSKRYLHATEQMKLDSVDLMNKMHGGNLDKDGPKLVQLVR